MRNIETMTIVYKSPTESFCGIAIRGIISMKIGSKINFVSLLKTLPQTHLLFFSFLVSS